MRFSGVVMTDEAGKVLSVSVGGAADLLKSHCSDMTKAAPETPAELVDEHEHLVDVLRSPSHEDDLAEADKQAKELADYKEEDSELQKSHVKGYTRKDGAYVKEHDDSRQAKHEDGKALEGTSKLSGHVQKVTDALGNPGGWKHEDGKSTNSQPIKNGGSMHMNVMDTLGDHGYETVHDGEDSTIMRHPDGHVAHINFKGDSTLAIHHAGSNSEKSEAKPEIASKDEKS